MKMRAGIVLSLMLLQISGVYAQSGRSSINQGPATPPNVWMRDAVNWSPSNDTVPATLRQARDQYFDEIIGLPVPLTPTNADSRHYSEGVALPNQPEIPAVANRSVVIGTFLSYQPVLSSSGRAVYTEVTLSLSNVFEDASGSTPAGSIITVILRGGTIRTEAGGVISYLTQAQSFCIKSGGTYLMALSFHASGNFYTIAKDWDLTNGTSKLNSLNGAGVPTRLVGLSVSQLIEVLNAQFAIKK